MTSAEQSGSVVPLAICGTVGALLGGPGAVFLGMLLANLYVIIWDPKPSSSYGYQDPFSGLGTFLLIGGIVFVIGAGLGHSRASPRRGDGVGVELRCRRRRVGDGDREVKVDEGL